MIYSILCGAFVIIVSILAACAAIFFAARAVYLYVKSLFIEEYRNGY